MNKMLKIKLIGLCLLLSTFTFAQNLDQKKQQLDDLNKKIDEENKLIQEVEQKTQNTKEDISSTKSKKSKAEKKIKSLKKSESTAKGKLDVTMNKLDLANKNLIDLHNLCELEFNKLCLAHYLSKIYPEKKVDTQLLSSIIQQTTAEINTRVDEKTGLEKKKEKGTKIYEDLIWTRIVTNKKKKKYSGQVASLNEKLSNYEEEKKAADQRVNEFKSQAAALDELITKLQADVLTDHFTFKFSTAKLIWPANGTVIKQYGEHKSDQYRVSLLNNGIDIGLEIGSDIFAVDDGVIAFAEWYNGAGKLIVIDHQNGFHTLYSHNSKLLVSKGDKIFRNQVIALSGMTGSAEVPSVHFELRKRGTPVNPLEYLE
ncbi:MAG: peptidoglycan DD-metalloendopeptidase family protein [Candidatus Tenebribacter burtonii]|jgi:murein DD-endopeptidase MepM/ murein hydrolase activator NlpD|nr:peptidoglycan DD-metalloendopeptidase family protein [Candidatus Tenebribacter burtonii]